MAPRTGQMGGFGLPPFTRGVKALLGVLVVTSVLVALFGRDTGGWIAGQLAFTPAELWRFKLWQPFTYTFLATDPLSLIFAGLGLWMLGGSLEQSWGTRRFVIFYFATSAIAALATAAVGLVWGRVAGFTYFGNWAVVEALVAAFAVAMPDAQILLYLFPVRARFMLPISAGITLLYALFARDLVPFLPPLFGLGAGMLLGGHAGPTDVWLRARVWWIDRRMRRSRLRVVPGLGVEDEDVPPRAGGRGSDKYLH